LFFNKFLSASPPMDVHYRPSHSLCKGYLSLFHLSAAFFYYFAKKVIYMAFFYAFLLFFIGFYL
ncbi:hypothetical protein ABTP95_17110, partial [Acinetobacter baumannii]